MGSKPDSRLAREIPFVLASAPHGQYDIRYIQWVSNFLILQIVTFKRNTLLFFYKSSNKAL